LKKLLFVFILSIFGSILFALPVNVQKDQYFNALEKAIDDKDYKKSKIFVKKLDLLIKEEKLKIKAKYYYFKAKSSYENAQYPAVYVAVEKYVEITKRSGKYYKKVLRILNDTDEALTKDEELERQRDLEIFIYKSDTFEDSESNGLDDALSLNWDEANEYCKNLVHADFTDWTLATKDQLRRLLKEKKSLQYVSDLPYWSSTSNKDDSALSWSVDFDLGSLSNSDKFDNSFLVRCVR